MFYVTDVWQFVTVTYDFFKSTIYYIEYKSKP